MENLNINIFVAAPQQSVALQQLVQAPNAVAVADLNDNNVMRTRKRQAQEYLNTIETKRRTDSTITVEDVEEAERFNVACAIGIAMPQIQAHIHVNMQAIMQGILDLQTGMANLQAASAHTDVVITAMGVDVAAIRRDVNTLQARSHNSTAHSNEDIIVPPQRGNQPVPANFPRTIAAFHGLRVGQRLSAIEDYYDLDHDGDLAARKNRIRREYGIGLQVVPAYGVRLV